MEGCVGARCENSAPQEDQIDSEDREGTALCCALLEKMEGVQGADERLAAAKKLQVMSLEAAWQPRLRHSGAIHRLVDVLRGQDEGAGSLKAVAAGVLWNLASLPDIRREIVLAGALGPLVGMLRSKLQEVRLGAAGALHMIVTDAASKVAVAEIGVIQMLVLVLLQSNAGNCTKQIQAKSLGVLQSLAVDVDNRRMMKAMLQPTSLMPLVASYLSSSVKEVQRNAVGLLHNLTLEDLDAQAAAVEARTVVPLVDMMRSGDDGLRKIAAAILCSMANGQERVRLKLDQGGILHLVQTLSCHGMDVIDPAPPKCNQDLSLDVSPYWQCKTCGIQGEFSCQKSNNCSSFGVGVIPDPLWHGWRDVLAIAGGSCFGLLACGIGIALDMDTPTLAALAVLGFVLSIALGGVIYTICMSAAGRHCCLCARARKWGTKMCGQCDNRDQQADLQRRDFSQDDSRGWGTVLTAFIVQSIDFMSDLAVIIVWASDKASPLRSILFQLGGFSIGVVLAINMYACMLMLDTSMRIHIWLSKYSNFSRNMILTCIVMALSSLHLHVVFIGMNSDFGPNKEMFLLKGLQTGLESLPMAFFMMLDIVSTQGSVSFVTVSSLFLSLLSVAYTCCCCVFRWYDDSKKRAVHAVQGTVVWGWVPAIQLFLFCFLDLSTSLAIYAILLSMWTDDLRIALIPVFAIFFQTIIAFMCIRVVLVGNVQFVWNATRSWSQWGDSKKPKITHLVVNVLFIWPLRALLCAIVAPITWLTSIPAFVIDLRIFLPGSKNISIRMMNIHAVCRRLILFSLSVLVVELRVGRQFYYLFGAIWCLYAYLSIQVFYYLGQIDVNLDSLLARSACWRRRGASAATVDVILEGTEEREPSPRVSQTQGRNFKFECLNKIPDSVFECGYDHCKVEHHRFRDTVQRFVDVSEAVLLSLADSSKAAPSIKELSCSCPGKAQFPRIGESLHCLLPAASLGDVATQSLSLRHDASCDLLIQHLIERAVGIILFKHDLDRKIMIMEPSLQQPHFDMLVERVADLLEEYYPSADSTDYQNKIMKELLWLDSNALSRTGDSHHDLRLGTDGWGPWRDSSGPVLREKSKKIFQPFHQRGGVVSESTRSSVEVSPDLDCDGKLRLWDSDEMRALPISKAMDIELWQSKVGTRLSSMLSVPAHSCSTFVSHSWSDSGRDKFYLLRKQLVLHKFDSTVLIVSIVVGLNMIVVGLMIQELSRSIDQVWWIPSVICLSAGVLLSLWAHAAGTWLPASFGPWWRSKQTVWLDKCCIDQTDDSTKQAGIANLGMHLMRCESMTVLLGPTYLSRLWTTFELATYCRELHDRKEDVKEKLHFLSLEWRQSSNNLLWLVRGIELSPGEVKALATYSCRDARCFLPKDRVTVLREIRRKWGSEEAFDHFVRTKLPGVLLSGKERYFRRFSHTFIETLNFIF